jgi:hypothetical protein
MHERRTRFIAAAALLLLAAPAAYLVTRLEPVPDQSAPAATAAEAPAPVETTPPPPAQPVANAEPATEPVEPAEAPEPPKPFKGTIQGSVTDALSHAPLEEFQLLVKTGRFLEYDPQKQRGFQTSRPDTDSSRWSFPMTASRNTPSTSFPARTRPYASFTTRLSRCRARLPSRKRR